MSITCYDCEAERDRLREENAKLRSIVNQVDDVLVVNWVGVEGNDYRKALAELVTSTLDIHGYFGSLDAKRIDWLANNCTLVVYDKAGRDMFYHTFGQSPKYDDLRQIIDDKMNPEKS